MLMKNYSPELFGCEHVLREAAALIKQVAENGEMALDTKWHQDAVQLLIDCTEYNPAITRGL